MFDNETSFLSIITTTTKNQIEFSKSPFDSWYIGGILFMLTVILVLLYANFYRENAFQILWNRLLITLRITQPSSQTVSSSSNPAMNTLLI